MADQKRPPEGWDGRFGKEFDDEISVSAIVKITVGLVGLSLFGIVAAWASLAFVETLREPPAKSPVPRTEASRLPTGPLLQPDPEAEMAELWNEMAFRLGAPAGPKKPPADSGAGWGWVDEAAGVVHIPIYQAIDLMLERSSKPAPEPAMPAVDEADTEVPAETVPHG